MNATSAPETKHRTPSRAAGPRSGFVWIDFVFAALAMGTFTCWIYRFRYQGLLGESDLYLVLNGLLDGARTSTYLASLHHYGKAFSFGYIMALYQFVDHQTLIDRLRMIALINEIGFWSSIAGFVAFWRLTWSLYGLRSATVAVTLFSLSPMMLELGTSGHQILPAFALFAAGSLCLLSTVKGAPRLPLALLGFFLLLLALVTRAEIVLGFPFLALARADLRSLPRFLKSAAVRSIVPAIAFATFLLVKHFYVEKTHGTNSLSSFLGHDLIVTRIPVGGLSILVGCGIATTIVGLLAAVLAVRRAVAAPPRSQVRIGLGQTAIGPLSLIIPPLIFWIAIPLPVRHFILLLAGMSWLVAWLLSTGLRSRPLAIYGLVAAIVFANQALGALTAPFILRHIPNKFIALPGDQHLLPFGLPVGSAWSYHRTYEGELLRTDRFAEQIRNSCEPNLLVLTNREQQILSILYHPDAAWDFKEGRIGKFPTWETPVGGRRVIVLSELGAWPEDAVAAALADPAVRDFKIELDPRAILALPHAAIPPDRVANLSCTRAGAG